MVDSGVAKYLKEGVARGHSIDVLKNELIKSGHSIMDVNSTVAEVTNKINPNNVGNKNNKKVYVIIFSIIIIIVVAYLSFNTWNNTESVKNTEKDFFCMAGNVFVESVNGNTLVFEYYGSEKIKPVTGDSIEMCCSKSEDEKYKECSRLPIVDGKVSTRSTHRINFERISGEYLKTYERSLFLENSCTYTFDEFGDVEVRSC